MHGPDGRRENATNIISSMPYCLHESRGAIGPQKSLFPLAVGLFAVKKSEWVGTDGEEPQVEEMVQWGERVFEGLWMNRGVGHAREVDGKSMIEGWVERLRNDLYGGE